jgi:hypothetical protein
VRALTAVALLVAACGPPAAGTPRAALGRPALIGYLDLSEPPGRAGLGSRSQSVFLRSMAAQHPRLLLRVVDVSRLAEAERRNRAHDWELAGGSLERLAGAAHPWFRGVVPTTVLLDERGQRIERWEGFVGAAELDRAIRSLAQPGGAPHPPPARPPSQVPYRQAPGPSAPVL